MSHDDLVLPVAVCPANPTPWRRLCLASSAVALAVTLAVLIGGVLGPEATMRRAVLALASEPVMDAARWMNVAGTWRVLMPATLALLIAVPTARPRWGLWVAVLAAAPLLGESLQEFVARPRPEGPGAASRAATPRQALRSPSLRSI
jgi:hypothetical protein